ncbi:MAG: putative spermidine/putrescine transport system permease componentof ATP-transporter system [Rhodobacteraceae bacterium]|uniref:ABC transporter permease n=1 Tax=Cypionkella sp. TaxID=2811411 RepID=UPI001325BED0|nr:ABC transporter permease [Cypionkella sp.]KAF0171150.1 MAG: putative spermidine/putrescine transport system permease componentof ATP-transporter system [Paracoccaceae bacterium]MDO8328118.1 ABC transporter permease [Cypionkella sp.]
MTNPRKLLGHIYMGTFLLYLIIPLVIMAGAAFNDSKLPSVVPWKGTTGRWFVDLWNDSAIWFAFRNTLLVAAAVAIIAVIIGTASAILINSISGRVRSVLYGVMVAPILAPGAVIGISTLLMWDKIGVGSGLHLSVLGQVSYIAAFVMLLVLARLQSFDQGLEEAALDLGASHAQVMRRILLPHLYPAIGAGAAIAFFQSIENFNVTLFTRGTSNTLTVYVFSKVRSGITPTINALAFLLIVATLVLALVYETNRRRKAKLEAAREAEGRRASELEE